jgi:hypothetical protein
MRAAAPSSDMSSGPAVDRHALLSLRTRRWRERERSAFVQHGCSQPAPRPSGHTDSNTTPRMNSSTTSADLSRPFMSNRRKPSTMPPGQEHQAGRGPQTRASVASGNSMGTEFDPLLRSGSRRALRSPELRQLTLAPCGCQAQIVWRGCPRPGPQTSGP